MDDLALMMKHAEEQLELHPHHVAWKFGASMFGYDVRAMPEPVGLLVGEAPGRHSNPMLPLFPHPENSSGARLLGYGNIKYEDYLGKLIRVNLDEWGESTETDMRERARIFRDEAAARQLRVLLLGRTVRDLFGCSKDHGIATFYSSNSQKVRIGWIPSPDKLDRMDFVAQEMAGIYLRWVIGGREP